MITEQTSPRSLVPTPVLVRRVTRETHDTVTLDLTPADQSAGLPFRPGQFNMMYGFGIGEVPISISGDPYRPERLIHTIRSVGAVTRALTSVAAGHWVGIRGPYGSSWPLDEGDDAEVLIVAGGLGLAPLRPAIYALLQARSRYRRVIVLYGARTPSDLLYRSELERWDAGSDLDVGVTVDRADRAWPGRVDVVPALLAGAGFDPARVLVMVCGPEVMMRFTIRELLGMGVPPDRIFLSIERNMKCAVGSCGHCQYGPTFVCKDGPIYRFDRIAWLFSVREV